MISRADEVKPSRVNLFLAVFFLKKKLRATTKMKKEGAGTHPFVP